MGEKTFEVVPVGVDYICDECKGGVMVFNKFIADVAVSGDAPYEHICNFCSHKQLFTEKYPTIRFNRKQ